MVDVEKFIKEIELEGYVKELLAEMSQIVNEKIQKDMPGVKIIIRIDLRIMGSRAPRGKK